MNLLSIRQQVIKISGRYDLATTTVVDQDTDNGIDFYINAGMSFLDKRFRTPKSKASVFEDVDAGSWYMTFQNCAAIEEVWCNDSEGRWKLTKYPYKTIKENYNELVSESDGGKPLFYSPVFIRSVSSGDYQSLGTFFNYIKDDDDGSYNGLVFAPKTDGVYNIEVIGRFYHEDLSNNTDENFWTIMAPMTLIKAALYQLEVFFKGTKTADRWIGFIDVEGKDLEFALVEQESNEARVEE